MNHSIAKTIAYEVGIRGEGRKSRTTFLFNNPPTRDEFLLALEAHLPGTYAWKDSVLAAIADPINDWPTLDDHHDGAATLLLSAEGERVAEVSVAVVDLFQVVGYCRTDAIVDFSECRRRILHLPKAKRPAATAAMIAAEGIVRERLISLGRPATPDDSRAILDDEMVTLGFFKPGSRPKREPDDD